MKRTLNRTTNDTRRDIVRKLSPDPSVPIFRSVHDNDATIKATKRAHCSLWNDRDIVLLPTNICPLENDCTVATKPPRAQTSIPKPFYANLSAEELITLYQQSFGHPDPATTFQPNVSISHRDFPAVQKKSKTLTLREFQVLWDKCLQKFGPFQYTEDLERQHSFREASLKCNAANQGTAHYGRTRFEACQVSFARFFLCMLELFYLTHYVLRNSFCCRKFSS